MNPLFRHMYMRPGNLWKEFEVLRKRISNVSGHKVEEWERTGDLQKGILAEASTTDREKTLHLWDQDQHSLTHTLVGSGTAVVKKGDRLDHGEKTYLVLTTDDVAGLGGSFIVYLEERNDLK